MELQQIGKYIAAKRKAEGLTQEALAQLLGVTNKAVSKWENGKCLPDLSHYEALCEILHISVNELMAGKDIEETELKKVSEQSLKEVLRSNADLSAMKHICIGLLLLLVGRCLPLVQLQDAASEATRFIFGVSEGMSIGITCIGIGWLIMGLVKFSK
ncbi:helix-turn-helix domain-containing protein [Dielma fastidiosa]|uniref:Helix-turn-helix domain-containing protein n=1 Tax=Dielma fastidiosa TaxID=1034346 RepID=A0AB35UU68_9FIRM|nr:helix-turn-helix transcriptional regulator [Dielma fastidiosa]MDY5168759.1 helix-turn-helix domain-containing protein [Dielma fastidiosa]